VFNSYEFTFAGESSVMYGLKLYDFNGRGQDDVSFGNKATVSETRVNNRIQPIHYGVNYHKDPLKFKLVFGAEEAMDRYTLEEISMWLTGYNDYQWLSIDQPDMEHVQFKCLITSLTPLSHGWLPVAFEAEVVCDCSYAYGHPFSKTVSGTSVVFRNESSVREYLRPDLTLVSPVGSTTLRIVNMSDGGRVFELTGLPSAATTIYVDNLNGIIRDENDAYNLYDGFNMNLFRLVPGDNRLTISGASSVTISGRFLHNVAG